MVNFKSLSISLQIQVDMLYVDLCVLISKYGSLHVTTFCNKIYFHRLYGVWKSDTYSQYPLLMRKKADIQKKSKAIMQRISKENVKPTSRKIGKVTNSSPVLLFEYVSILKRKF